MCTRPSEITVKEIQGTKNMVILYDFYRDSKKTIKMDPEKKLKTQPTVMSETNEQMEQYNTGEKANNSVSESGFIVFK